jgi:hypothetical protein
MSLLARTCLASALWAGAFLALLYLWSPRFSFVNWHALVPYSRSHLGALSYLQITRTEPLEIVTPTESIILWRHKSYAFHHPQFVLTLFFTITILIPVSLFTRRLFRR